MIDTHCHLDLKVFNDERDQILTNTHSLGIRYMLLPAIKQSGWHNLLKICAQSPRLLPALGLHPLYIHEHRATDLLLLKKQLQQRRPMAIGEIGLDLQHGRNSIGEQIDLFSAQVKLGHDDSLPLILHVRKGHEDVLKILHEYQWKRGGFVHAFNGSLQQAQCYLDMGFKIGIGGMATYQRSTRIRSLIWQLKTGDLVLETDAPDMPPEPYHGQRNSPEYLPLVVQAIAEIKEISINDVIAATTQAVDEVLQIP